MPRQTFHQVLTAAVADFAEHGYDSEQRLRYWMEEIQRAAEAELIPAAELERTLAATLGAIYRRLVERGALLKQHPGVSRFTLDRIAPRLRTELDRRILASADLIKLNREESVRKTLQRFSGWATSVPEGGSEAISRRETKADLSKALASQPFEVRRVAIDQGHKLVASINSIVAQDAGAIAAIWHHHHVRYPRPTHVMRDGKVFLIRGSWAHERGYGRVGENGYSDEIEQPAEWVGCRCAWTWVYSLSDLPAELVTDRGRAALAEARAKAA